MKLIYVTASLPYGNTEVFAIPEVSELIRRGHEVKLVPMSRYTLTPHSDAAPFMPLTEYRTLTSGEVLRVGSAELPRALPAVARVMTRLTAGEPRNIVKKNVASLPRGLWLARKAREWGADHIHAYWASVAATTAMIAAEVSGVAWSFTAHRWDITQPNAFRAKIESARFARFISQDGLELARSASGPELEQKAAIIRMGVPLSPHGAKRTAPPAGVQLRLICTGTLIPRKGQRFLLEALSQLKARGVHVELSLAGEGETRGALEAQAETLAVADRVTFLGNVDHNALLAGYAEGRYDAFILPSLHEGISVALIEAMSYGLPVIATDVGGTRELLTAGAGQLIPAEDVGSIVDAILTLDQNEPERVRQGRAGQERVMAEYDIKGIVDALERRFQAPAKARRNGNR